MNELKSPTHHTDANREAADDGLFQNNGVNAELPTTPVSSKFPVEQQQHEGLEVERSLTRRTFSLPIPVPCTGSTAPAKLFSLTKQSSPLPPVVSRAYPHLDLPDYPEYFFDKIVFTPNFQLLSDMVDMGITDMVAIKALYWTGNSCIKLACNWVLDRNEDTLKTPLEVEKGMLKSDLDIKEEEVRERIKSIDSGICMMGDDELDSISLDFNDLDVYKLVLVVNKSFHFLPQNMATLAGRATGHIMANVGVLEEGDDQLEIWEACGEQVVLYEGANTAHLLDLRLAAQCLGLQWVEEGRLWDRVNRRYREVGVLGIWGVEERVDMVVGRLEQML